MADSAPNCFDHVDPPVISAVEQCETTTDTPLTGALVRCSSYADEPPDLPPLLRMGGFSLSTQARGATIFLMVKQFYLRLVQH